jgi:hypothetical protein
MAFLPALAAIATIASAGTTVGLDIANSGGPSAPKTPAVTGPTPAQQQQTQLQEKAAVTQQLPTIEGLTSGFANPGYYAQQGATAAGVAGQPGGQNAAAAAVEKAFGLPPGTLSGASGTPKAFKPVGTGQANTGAFPRDPVQLSDFVNSFVTT